MPFPPLKSRFQILLLSSLLGCLPASYTQAGQVLRISSVNCVVVGRIILSSDLGIPGGMKVCERDQLQVSRSRRVDVLCPTQRQVVQLQSGTHRVASLCNSMQVRPRRCHMQSWLSCLKLRGGKQAQATPQLQNPAGELLMRPPTQLSWQSVPNATHYQVFIEGEGQQWMAALNEPQVSLVDRAWQLKPEGSYLVTTVAFQGDRSVAQSAKAINILSTEACKQTEARLASIQSIGLAQFEEVQLFDDLLVAENLLDESIALLEGVRQRGYQSSQLLVRLGDRYLESGQWRQAHQSYSSALSLSPSGQSDSSLMRAKLAVQELQPLVAQ